MATTRHRSAAPPGSRSTAADAASATPITTPTRVTSGPSPGRRRATTMPLPPQTATTAAPIHHDAPPWTDAAQTAIAAATTAPMATTAVATGNDSVTSP